MNSIMIVGKMRFAKASNSVVFPNILKMRTNELELERMCRNYARALGWVCCKLEKNAHKGIPDDLFISPSQECFLIEFKKDEKQKPRPEQAVWLARFSKIAFLVGSFEQFCRTLKLPPYN